MTTVIPDTLLSTPTDPLETLRRFDFTGDMPMWKIGADLDRYATVIKATRPTVIIETGTHKGGSARWFARQPDVSLVISVDIEPARRLPTNAGEDDAEMVFVYGDSTALGTVQTVHGHLHESDRVMVVLDSAHTAEHVLREIELYAPLVTPGCLLVVEDTIFHWATPEQWAAYGFGNPADGTPLDAVAETVHGSPLWERDLNIEGLHELSHHPAGWWRRTEVSR